MTIRSNSVSFAFAHDATALAAATRRELAAATVQVDETSSRTFTSVFVEVVCRGNETSSTSMTSRLIGIKIDAAAFSDETKSETITTTGDQHSFRFRRDVTSYFNTNFTGTSHSVQVAVQFGGLATINHCARLVVTYQYDDATATTRTKTAYIPLDSAAGTLTTTLTEIGTNQIPQLTGVGGFLPESGITIRDQFLWVQANEGHDSGTTDDQLAIAIDAESETLFGVLEQALDSSPWMELWWKRTDLSASSAHAFRARSVAVTNRFPQLCAIYVVTYSYDHPASVAANALLHSLRIPFPNEPSAFGGATSGLQSKISVIVPIEDPGTITLKQSGVLMAYNMPNSLLSGLNIAIGAQSHRAYTPSTLYNSPAGPQTVCQRFDSGAAAGLGVTLARGENEITLSWYRTSTGSGGAGYGMNALLILNYVSGADPAGAGAHTRTIELWGGGTDAVGASTVRDYTFQPSIPESAYWVVCMGFAIDYLQAGRGAVSFLGERQAGEGLADGWEILMVNPFCVSNENSVNTLWCNASAHFDRHPSDPDAKRLAVENSRAWRMSSFLDGTNSHGGWSSFVALITYHTLTRSLSGAVSGYDSGGNGSGITVNVRRADTGDLLYQAATSSGGGYSITAYSNTLALFAEARQDATHVGRSNNFTPS
ncbi:hypothetical protein [Sorangium sp. So ce388]|uniref:hypothetical protein n=1 Tax=Sorangium sp. So ce388 TaxID=3133309 RepID=UPI003F5B4A0E